MTTDTERAAPMKWDAFMQPQMEDHVAMWRKTEWPTIRRELKLEFDWDISDEEEPHWMAGGSAVFWAQEITRVAEPVLDGNGKPVMRRGGVTPLRQYVDKRGDWVPVSPESGLPATTASQINAYLKKGFRLRPPINGVAEHVRKIVEDAVPPPKAEAERVYGCNRHTKGYMDFKTWKSYVRHCMAYGELIEEDPPLLVAEKRAASAYYCIVCDVSMKEASGAARHKTAAEQRALRHKAPLKYAHPTVEQMRVDEVSHVG